jgi:hypothetical protein
MPLYVIVGNVHVSFESRVCPVMLRTLCALERHLSVCAFRIIRIPAVGHELKALIVEELINTIALM